MTEAVKPLARQRIVTVIPQRVQPAAQRPVSKPALRRVAGYARVSTASDEQENSYAAQVAYFTEYITAHPGWEFVKIYTDEGISGTSTRRREGFKAMIADALAGKIDLIVTKSVSRFARNTIDSLSTIRELKEHGVEVFFQKENINTFDGKGELLLTIMSSLAQEESRSLSENVTWGIRKSFSDGKVSILYKSFLGYRRGPDGRPEIDPKEAEVVRTIYKLFLEGDTPTRIATALTQANIPSPRQKAIWASSAVASILTNEKYMGDAILQKTFVTNYLTKKIKKNEGEIPQYHVQNSHPAIVSNEVFDLVQEEIERRRQFGINYSGRRPELPRGSDSIFNGKVVCGCCGALYGGRIRRCKTPPYWRTIWICNKKYMRGSEKPKHRCPSPPVWESVMKSAFLQVVRRLLEEREDVLRSCREVLEQVLDTNALRRQERVLLGQVEDLEQELGGAAEKSDSLEEERARITAKIERLRSDKADRERRLAEGQLFLENREALCESLEFDRTLFAAIAENVVVSGVRKKPLLEIVLRSGQSHQFEV